MYRPGDIFPFARSINVGLLSSTQTRRMSESYNWVKITIFGAIFRTMFSTMFRIIWTIIFEIIASVAFNARSDDVSVLINTGKKHDWDVFIITSATVFGIIFGCNCVPNFRLLLQFEQIRMCLLTQCKAYYLLHSPKSWFMTFTLNSVRFQ